MYSFIDGFLKEFLIFSKFPEFDWYHLGQTAGSVATMIIVGIVVIFILYKIEEVIFKGYFFDIL